MIGSRIGSETSLPMQRTYRSHSLRVAFYFDHT
nr:MAG TPA: hypothetical protein [Caudoviricetes sp.]